jgi:hypothetical protein
VRRLAGEDHRVALDAERAEHGGGRLGARLEHRALLDVQLEVRAGAVQPRARLGSPVEVDVEARDDVLQPLAVAVAQVAHGVGVERPRAGRRAEQRAAEPRALLVGPVDELERDRRPPVLGRRADRLQRPVDPERAVEPAACGHRVRVRADDHEPLAVALERRPQVPRLVHVDRDRQLAEPLPQQLARLDPLVCPAHAPGAVRAARAGGQLAQVREHPVGVHEATGVFAQLNDRRTKRPCPGEVTISPRS